MADIKMDISKEEDRAQKLRKQLDELGYTHLVLGEDSVPLVEKLLSDLIQAKKQQNTEHLPLVNEISEKQKADCSSSCDSHQITLDSLSDQRDSCGDAASSDLDTFNLNVKTDSSLPIQEQKNISNVAVEDKKINDVACLMSNSDDSCENEEDTIHNKVSTRNRRGKCQVTKKKKTTVRSKRANHKKKDSKEAVKKVKPSKHEDISYQCKQCCAVYKFVTHLQKHIRRDHKSMKSGMRGNYKPYGEEDVILAINAIQDGLSFRKASVRFGIPHSTLLGRVQSMRQWEASQDSLSRDDLDTVAVMADEVDADSLHNVESQEQTGDTSEAENNLGEGLLYMKPEILNPDQVHDKNQDEINGQNLTKVRKIVSNIKQAKVARLKHLRQMRSRSKTEFPCRDCGMVFESSWKLNVHRHRVHKIKPTDCNICGKQYRNERDMRRHRAYAHLLYKSKSCDKCGKTFKNYICLKRHRKVHDISSLTKYGCDRCSKVFSTKYTLEKHILRTHEENGAIAFANFTCHICGKTFEHNSYLNVHIDTVHNKLRPFICEVCGKTFPTQYYLKRHRLRQHSEVSLRTYQCIICEKTYRSRSSLNSHQRLHQPHKQFTCHICGQEFTQKGSLDRHELIIHKGIKPYVCKLCGSRFRDSYMVSKHLMNTHNIPKEQTDKSFELWEKQMEY